MTLPAKSIAAYADLEPLLQAALRSSPIDLQFSTPGECTNLISRLNYYRVKLRERNEEKFGEHSSPYDELMFRKLKPGNTTCRIERRSISATILVNGVPTTLEELTAETEIETGEASDEELDFAKHFTGVSK